MSKKRFTEWEKELGLFALTEKKFDTSASLTKEEFKEIYLSNHADFIGVDYEVRVKFLQDNDYKVTRENLVNPELSVRQADES